MNISEKHFLKSIHMLFSNPSMIHRKDKTTHELFEEVLQDIILDFNIKECSYAEYSAYLDVKSYAKEFRNNKFVIFDDNF